MFVPHVRMYIAWIICGLSEVVVRSNTWPFIAVPCVFTSPCSSCSTVYAPIWGFTPLYIFPVRRYGHAQFNSVKEMGVICVPLKRK